MKRKHNCPKILALFSVVVLILLLSNSVQAAPYVDEKCGENATWTIDGTNTLIISGTGAVTGSPWYDYYRNDFDGVLVSEGITSLPAQGFRHCANLRQITLPASVTSLGTDCFSGCGQLQTVNYNGTLEQWRRMDFADTSGPLFQAKLICANGTYNMCGADMYWTLDDEGTLSITGTGPMSDFSAGAPAPWHSLYSSIHAVTVEEGVTAIGSYAFYNLDPWEPFAMTQIKLPRSLARIGSMAFADCTNLTDVYYGDTCDRWTRLTVEPHNEMLQSVVLHGSDKTVSMCGQATYWELDSHGTLTVSGLGATASWNGYTTAPWHDHRYDIQKIVVSQGVTHIGNRAFDGVQAKEAILADSVLSIGNYAFDGCYNLEQIAVGASLVWLNEGAFENCDRLKTITLPDTVTTIGKYAFRNCEDLEAVTLGTGVTGIGREAFGGCSALTEMTLPKGITAIADCTFANCQAMERIVLPPALKTVGGGAFWNCTSLTGIRLPDTVETVEYQAFYGCTGLTELYIPAKTVSFDPGATQNCLRLAAFRVDPANPVYASDPSGVLFNREMTLLIMAPSRLDSYYRIPDTVTKIDYQGFYFTDLSSVYIPVSVGQVSDDAFGDGPLTSVYYGGTKAQWNNITICGGNEALMNAAIYYESNQGFDLNADGILDSDDAVYLLLHTMFGETFYPLNNTPADADGNGTVNQDDAVYLLLHTMFGDTFYPLNA